MREGRGAAAQGRGGAGKLSFRGRVEWGRWRLGRRRCALVFLRLGPRRLVCIRATDSVHDGVGCGGGEARACDDGRERCGRRQQGRGQGAAPTHHSIGCTRQKVHEGAFGWQGQRAVCKHVRARRGQACQAQGLAVALGSPANQRGPSQLELGVGRRPVRHQGVHEGAV